MNLASYEDLKAYAAAAARLLDCNAEDLLAFRWAAEEQQFIAIAPSGAKHRFELEQLEAATPALALARKRGASVAPAPTHPETIAEMAARHTLEDQIEEQIAADEAWPTEPPAPPADQAAKRPPVQPHRRRKTKPT